MSSPVTPTHPAVRRGSMARSIAATLVLVLAPCLARGQEFFPLRPSWISLSAGSQDGALGDIDRDGDLDLVSTTSLYLNDGRRLQRFPSWQTGLAFPVHAVAVGDVDRDGSPDAVFGGDDGLRLFRGDGVMLEARVSWELPGARVTDLALGDLDGDGDLDLACAYGDSPSAVYPNANGVFADVPAWTTPPGLAASTLALGDVSGDGRIDLVLAGWPTKALFLNAGDLGTAPAWELVDSLRTADLALGDLDGDGSLDLVCAHSGAASAWYRNMGGAFDPSPAWQSASTYDFSCVTLGDVQLDGDLDAVFGEVNQGCKLFVNSGGSLQAAPAWEATAQARASSVAFGDLNADGVLDLVCANADAPHFLYEATPLLFSGPALERPGLLARDFAFDDVDADGDLDGVVIESDRTALYRNDAGVLTPDPVWTGPVAWDVALGDVDNDGDLDLVCANLTQPNTMWAFDRDAGTFGTQPAWEGERAEGTVSIALGDADSDGQLDLLCGNHGTASHIWPNVSGRFATVPLWVSKLPLDSPTAVFGDVDRNGRLDVVIGSPTGTFRFLNLLNRIEETPSWSLQFPEDTTDIVLGDMDGDGDLDLVCGNDDGPNTLHRNSNGDFEQSTSWFPESYFGRVEIALGDVDADGDLDLVSVGEGLAEGSSLYLNTGSGLDDRPSWEEETRARTLSVACGDLDADGDIDLLLGHESGAALRRNLTAPAAGFHPTGDAARLPNEPAQLRNVRVGDSGNIRDIDFVAYDAESDSIWILAEYQEWGGATSWQPVISPGIVPPRPGTAKGPFAASARGVPGSIVWDLAGLPFGSYHLSLRLRTISHPQHAGTTQIIPAHLFDVGTLLARRPFLQFAGLAADSTLVFDRVTVGDTVHASFEFLNLGNDTLRVLEMVLPFHDDRDGTDDLLFDVKAPFGVAPGGSQLVRTMFLPGKVWPEHGFVQIRCNDPTRPHTGFDVLAPSLDLTVRTQVLSTQDPVPLAQPLTIQVLPDDGVLIEKATLFHRRPGVEEFTPVTMQQLPGEPDPDGPFLVNIQGANLTEVGLEFFVQLENSGILATDPQKAPLALHEIRVQPPQSFAVTPLQTGTTGYLSGRAISVIADIPEGAVFTRGSLYWRRGGEMQWHPAALELFEFDTIATIPDSGVGERGVQFYVEMFTATTTLLHPSGGGVAPAEIQVRVPLLKEPHTQPGGRYRMVSFPLQFDTQNLLVDQLLGDGEGFGPYDPTRWRLYRYDADALANAEFAGTRPDLFAPMPGTAFWLVSRNEHRVDTAPIEGFSVAATAPGRTIFLQKGWNQIGDPFPFPVAWSGVETSTPLEPPIAFDPARGPIGDYADEPATVLEPFAGYFVYNPGSAQETIVVPPVESGSVAAKPARLPLWSVRLVAASDAAADAANRFGMDPGASEGPDAFDALEPPPAPGDWVQLAFVLDGELRRRDVRPLADGHAWDVEVRAARRGTRVQVTAGELQNLPAHWTLRLLDRELGTGTDATASAAIFAFGPEKPYRLRVLAGPPAWVEQAAMQELAVPVAFVADRVAPNPFRDATRFHFGIPRAAPVELQIYDVRGARIATLADGKTLPAGYHVRIWDGRDHSGRSAANGVYFARLRAGDRLAQWRLVLMR